MPADKMPAQGNKARPSVALPLQPSPPTNGGVALNSDQSTGVARNQNVSVTKENTRATNNGRVSNGGSPTEDARTDSLTGSSPQNGIDAAKHEPKLSGDASTFKPAIKKPAPISLLNRNSTADDSPVIVSSNPLPSAMKNGTGAKANGAAVQEPIGTLGPNVSPTRKVPYFTTDICPPRPDMPFPGSHYVKIEHVLKTEFSELMKTLYSEFGWVVKVKGTHAVKPSPESDFLHMYICFDDVRDAKNALGEVQLVNTKLKAHYISQTEYQSSRQDASGNGTRQTTSFHDGQVSFDATYTGSQSDFSTNGLFESIERMAADFGDVLGVSETEFDGDGARRHFRVEFFKITDAKVVVGVITADTPVFFTTWEITTKELPDHTAQATKETSPTNHSVMSTPRKLIANDRVEFCSPTGRTTWRVDAEGNNIPTNSSRKLPVHTPTSSNGQMMTPRERWSVPEPETPGNQYGPVNYGGRSNSWTPSTGSSNYHSPYTPSRAKQPVQTKFLFDDVDTTNAPQNVHYDKIQSGFDCRTTIMLRNIPSGMQPDELKRIIDRTSFGLYDFIYLRMDFNTNSNVGYGFINFTHSLNILNFLSQHLDKPWVQGITGVKRKCQVSYATIQGIECLVGKFRNSAIMSELPNYRPKLLWSWDSAANEPDLVGKEKAFPAPDNELKHQRSLDNAGHIGLYGPNARRGFPGVNTRGRRSHFDRGTPAQMREEAFHHQAAAPFFSNGAPVPIGPPAFAQGPYSPAYGYDGYSNPYPNASPMMYQYGYNQNAMPYSDPFSYGHGGQQQYGVQQHYGGQHQMGPPAGMAPMRQFGGRPQYHSGNQMHQGYNAGYNGRYQGAQGGYGNGFQAPLSRVVEGNEDGGADTDYANNGNGYDGSYANGNGQFGQY